MKKILMVFVIFAAVYSLTGFGHVSAQNDKAAEETVEKAAPSREDSTVKTLNALISSMNDLKEQIKEKKHELRSAHLPERKDEILKEIDFLDERLNQTEGDFEKVSTGVDMETFQSKQREDFNWKEEARDLLWPVIQELKNMTDRPRKIEKLRSEAAYYVDRLNIVEKALANIRNLMGYTKEKGNKELVKQLKGLETSWLDKKQQIGNNLTVSKYQLVEMQKQKKSIFESVQNIIKIFFKSRGRNFLFALLAFVIVFLGLRLLQQQFYRIAPKYKKKQRTFFMRLGDVIYYVFTVVGAIGALLLVLYASGDWVLLSLFIIFLLGLAWTAKQGLPRFWEQIKLLLNLGTVRENERLVYNGIPWRVVSLNIYTMLENPELKGGRMRLPLRALVDLNSRPYSEEEPWFPCKESDWVILSDDVYGKVVMMTPEYVRVVLLGGAVKTYLTPDFLALSPRNLSTNFRIRSTFGVDYAHQEICTEEIPEKMQTMLVEELNNKGYGDAVLDVNVEFKTAGASSLDLEMIINFSGDVAHRHEALGRLMQRIAVDSCNRYGWVIPFTQVTLHPAKPLFEAA